MKYIYVINNIVHEILFDFNEDFPNIPIQQRYAKEFLDSCVVVEGDVDVQTGMVYENGEFYWPEPEYIPPNENDEDYQPTPSDPTLAMRVSSLETELDITQEALNFMLLGGI